ncbi:MAG: hypothetical protein ACT4N2_09260 [Hyphomicrobium sp.]
MLNCGFDERGREAARSWCAEMVSADTWVPTGRVLAGFSRPVEFKRSDGLIVAAKPALQQLWNVTIHAGAHEKIAADLAAEICACVPGGILYREEAGSLWSLSSYPFDGVTWTAARLLNLLHSDAELAGVMDQLAAGFVFHNWIGDIDHEAGEHDGNLLVAFDHDGVSGIAFVDHTLSLSHTWGQRGFEFETLQNSYYVTPGRLPKAALRLTMDRIEALPEFFIRDTVLKIPADFLQPEFAELISKGLLSRRTPLSRALSEELQA